MFYIVGVIVSLLGSACVIAALMLLCVWLWWRVYQRTKYAKEVWKFIRTNSDDFIKFQQQCKNREVSK